MRRTIHKLAAAMICAVILMTPLLPDFREAGASAEEEQPEYELFQNGDYSYRILPDETVEIMKYGGTEETVTVPAQLDGREVSGIGSQVFNQNQTMQELVLPDTVKTIDSFAFQRCASLNSIHFSRGLRTIGNHAFTECNALEVIVLPGSLREVGARAFQSCERLERVIFRKGLQEIGDLAFAYCNSLASVWLPDSLCRMGADPFSRCVSLKGIHWIGENETFLMDEKQHLLMTADGKRLISCFQEEKSFTIQEGVEELGGYLFSGWGSLREIEFPESLRVIGEDAFNNCNGLRRLALPAGVTEIGDGAFQSCKSLEEILLPEKLQRVGQLAFFSCKGLKEITLPAGVKTLGLGAFMRCSGLRQVTFEGDLEAMEDEAFFECVALESAVFKGDVERLGEDVFTAGALKADRRNLEKLTVTAPAGSHLAQYCGEHQIPVAFE